MSRFRLLLPALPLLLVSVTELEGQGLNGRARTSLSYIQVREFVLDSVPASEVPGQGTQRTLPDGTPATCGEVYCEFYRSGPTVGVAPLLQDLELNFWTTITGLRAYVHLRGREPLGERDLWPRSEKSLEALAAYVEYSRSFYRVQAGRIWLATALGLYNYDGGSLFLSLPRDLNLQLFGGLSLVRGLNQRHHTSLISSVEELAPRQDSYLGGFHASWRPIPDVSAALTYQREGTGPADDLYSHRIAGSAQVLLGPATVNGEVRYDLASKSTNLLRVAVAGPLTAGFRGKAEFRRYLPFFELWTIWGAFSPVGFVETTGRLDWSSPSGRISAHASGSYRAYEDSHVESPEEYGIRDDGWRMAAGGSLTARDDLLVRGEFRYDVGFGASRSGGDLSVQRTFGSAGYLALQGTVFQTISELRVGSGRVYGLGLEGRTPLATPLGLITVQGGAGLYRHDQRDRPSLLDLNQVRLHLDVEVPIGRDPGMAGRGAP